MMPRRGAAGAERATTLVRRHRPDYRIVLYMGLLMLIGLIVMYAIGPARANVLNNSYDTSYYGSTYFFVKQTTSLFLALVAFAVAASLPYQLLQKHAGKLVWAGIIASALLVVFGNFLHIGAITQCSLGACRWFSLGPLGTIQPAEFMKFSLLIFGAGFLGVRAQQGLVNDVNKTLVPLGILTLVSLLFIIVIQKDMGTGITLVAMLAAMIIMAGLNRKMGLAIAGIFLALGILLIVIAPHRIDRVTTFFSGDHTTSGQSTDYHIEHAKMAIGTGGLFGVGIGNSVEATGYLPEAINDSIFAIMGEIFGFVGLVAILGLFTALLLRLLKVADALVDVRMKILVAGVFGWFGSHVILNVGAMIGIIPLTGITLPLLSFGGTSMVFVAAALGLAFQLSRYTVFGSKLRSDEYEDSQRRRGVGRSRHAGRRRFA